MPRVKASRSMIHVTISQRQCAMDERHAVSPAWNRVYRRGDDRSDLHANLLKLTSIKMSGEA